MTQDSQTLTEDLKPCPFCGCSEVFLFDESTAEDADFGVQCHGTNCFIIGPRCGTREQAAIEWNSRPGIQISSGEALVNEDLARQICSYTDGEARKNVYKAALQVLTAMTPRPKPASVDGLRWDGWFSVIDPEPENDHSAIYLVCPNGLMVNTSCDPTPGLDARRTQWMADTLNAALNQGQRQ